MIQELYIWTGHTRNKDKSSHQRNKFLVTHIPAYWTFALTSYYRCCLCLPPMLVYCLYTTHYQALFVSATNADIWCLHTTRPCVCHQCWHIAFTHYQTLLAASKLVTSFCKSSLSSSTDTICCFVALWTSKSTVTRGSFTEDNLSLDSTS